MVPLVSTVIPTRNRAAMLPGAIRSALAQRNRDGSLITQEIIVADDDSTDGTPSVVAEFVRMYPDVVRYHRTKTGTPGGTRNAGAGLARGRFLAFLDDDDEWLPGRLALALAVFQEHPAAAFVYGQATPTDGDLRHADTASPFPALPLAEGHPVAAFLKSSPHLNATLFRRAVFESVNGFDASLSGFEDTDLLLRVVRRHPCYAVQAPLTLMRFHTDGLNNTAKLWQRYQDEARARRYHLSVKDGYRPGFSDRVRLSLRNRGWYVHRFLSGLQRATPRQEFWQSIRYALLTSPFHALKSPLLWQAIRDKGVKVP